MSVVLVIIAIILALIVPNVIGTPHEARVTVAKSDTHTLAAALELYRLDARRYLTTEQGSDAPIHRPVLDPGPKTWADGGSLAALPQDLSGRDVMVVVRQTPLSDHALFQVDVTASVSKGARRK